MNIQPSLDGLQPIFFSTSRKLTKTLSSMWKILGNVRECYWGFETCLILPSVGKLNQEHGPDCMDTSSTSFEIPNNSFDHLRFHQRVSLWWVNIWKHGVNTDRCITALWGYQLEKNMLVLKFELRKRTYPLDCSGRCVDPRHQWTNWIKDDWSESNSCQCSNFRTFWVQNYIIVRTQSSS